MKRHSITCARLTRRILPAALALLLASGSAFAAEVVKAEPGFSNFTRKQDYTAGHFTDVHATDWFSAGVQSAFELGLMTGKSKDSFMPQENVKLCEAISMAAKTNHVYNGGDGTLPQYADSPYWYTDALNYAVTQGIVKPNDFADLEAPATRAQLAYIFSGAVPEDALAPINAVGSVPDVNDGTPFADHILRLYRAGVISGNDQQGTYYPEQSITRGEAASILSLVAVPSKRKSFVLKETPQPPANPGVPPSTTQSAVVPVSVVFQDRDNEFTVSATDRWTAVAEEKPDDSKKIPPGTKPVTPSAFENRLHLSLSETAAGSGTDEKTDGKTDGKTSGKTDSDKSDTTEPAGELIAYVSQKTDAAAPLSVFHSLMVKNLAAELQGREVSSFIYIALDDGTTACFTPLLSGASENARYWVLTADDGGQFITLVGRLGLDESADLQNEMITVIKSLRLS